MDIWIKSIEVFNTSEPGHLLTGVCFSDWSLEPISGSFFLHSNDGKKECSEILLSPIHVQGRGFGWFSTFPDFPLKPRFLLTDDVSVEFCQSSNVEISASPKLKELLKHGSHMLPVLHNDWFGILSLSKNGLFRRKSWNLLAYTRFGGRPPTLGDDLRLSDPEVLLGVLQEIG